MQVILWHAANTEVSKSWSFEVLTGNKSQSILVHYCQNDTEHGGEYEEIIWLLHVLPPLGAHVDSVVVCLLNWNFASSIKVMCVWETLVYKGKCRDHHGMQTNANLHLSGTSYSAVPDYSGPVMSYYSLCVSAALCECYWMVSTVMVSVLTLLGINNWTLSLMFLGYCPFMLIIFCPF